MNSNLVVILWALTAAGPALAGPDAAEIMKKSEEARRLSDVTSDSTLITTTEGKNPKAKKFTWWRKVTGGTRFNTLTRFHEPPDIRGEGILFLERERDNNEVLLYLPAMKKVRRVESQSQSSSFMGSAFSYADIAAPHAEDFDHKLLRTEPCPGEAAKSCYVIESTPNSDSVRERTGYGRLVQWIHPDHYLPIHSEFYAPDGALAKRLSWSKIKEVDPKQKKSMAHWVQISDERRKLTTTLAFDNVRAGTGLKDATFTQQNLMQE